MKVILTKGLPASGKTTWATDLIKKEPNKWKRINKDDLRAMLDAGQWSRENEKYVLEVRDTLITWSIMHGYNVIIDDTNLASKHEARIKQIIDMHNNNILPKQEQVNLEIKDFTDVSVEICIERDSKRSNSVGAKVIRQMYNQFLRPQVPVVAVKPNLSHAIICDIDGTLALFGKENPYDRDFSKDQINEAIAQIVRQQEAYGKTIIMLSGRKEKNRQITEEWLKKHSIYFKYLWMRQDDDNRKDFIMKKELYEKHIQDKFNIDFVLDDRDQVVAMWRSLGLVCLQVAEGNF